MNAITYAKQNLEESFGLLNACAGGMDDTQYNLSPPGTCNNIARTHVHAVASVDFFVLASVKGGQMLWPAVAETQGLSASPLEIWKHEGDISLDAIAEYSKNVQRATLDFVATMKDDDLDREIDSPFFGKKPVGYFLQLAGTHAVGHGGEMAAIKGMQGLKGLPF